MCTGPELLCLDEPAAGLNPKESLALNTLLNGIKATGTSILLIEHDMSVVMQISDHVVVLEYGRKISDGDPTFVKSDPRVIAAYLGVEDEEVENVLVEVGDEDVIETFDAEPDREHGPGDSASFMAGPISDTVGHSDPSGEVVRVAPGASRAELVERRLAAAEAAAAASKHRSRQNAHQAEGRGKTCADREVHRGQGINRKIECIGQSWIDAGVASEGSGLWLGANCQAGIPDQTGCAETCRQAGGKVRFRKTAGICGRTAGKTCGEGGSCQGCRDISPSQTCRCGQIFFVVAKTGRVSGSSRASRCGRRIGSRLRAVAARTICWSSRA
jgi:hypothetical protein